MLLSHWLIHCSWSQSAKKDFWRIKRWKPLLKFLTSAINMSRNNSWTWPGLTTVPSANSLSRPSIKCYSTTNKPKWARNSWKTSHSTSTASEPSFKNKQNKSSEGWRKESGKKNYKSSFKTQPNSILRKVIHSNASLRELNP